MSEAEPLWLTQEQQSHWRSYIVGTTLLLDALDRELRRSHGLSLGEYEVLVRLSECPDRTMRMAQLAEALRHSRSRITHTITRMEGAGWVTRQASDDDRRGVNATMTDAGHDLLIAAAPTHVQGVRNHFVDLATPDDFEAVGRVMDRVADQLIGGDVSYLDIRT